MRRKGIAVIIAITSYACATQSHAGSASYTYDALGRLAQVQSSTGVSAGYQYDALGNWISRILAPPPSAAPSITSTTVGPGSVTFNFIAPTAYTGAPITGYVANCGPGGLSANVWASATSVMVSGLSKGTTYTCTIAPDSAVGLGGATPTQAVVGGSQTISFSTSLGVAIIGLNRAISVSASSGLTITLSTTTPTICGVVSGTTIRGLVAGDCSLTAAQAGDANFLAATSVSVTLRVVSAGALLFLFNDD